MATSKAVMKVATKLLSNKGKKKLSANQKKVAKDVIKKGKKNV